MWRQYLESLSHDENCFVTLTYSPEHLPAGGNLEPLHVQLWLKKLRKALHPIRIRYFLVGEYGDESERAHYHLSLFGVSGNTLVPRASGPTTLPNLIASTWSYGLIHVGEFNELTAQYVAGYVTKKMTREGDPRLNGRVPEFARMSLRPGIGADAMAIVANTFQAARLNEPLPTSLKIGRRTINLGRFLLSKLRIAAGLTPEQIQALKSEVALENSINLQALLQDAITASPRQALTVTDVYLQEVKQKILQVEARHNIYKKRSSL